MIRLLLTGLLVLAGLWPISARAMPPQERLDVLRRGVNLTNWFRYPASLDPAKIRVYLSTAVIMNLRQAGFGFVRLAVQPEILMAGGALRQDRLNLLLDAIRRLQHAGLGVVIAPHPFTWRLENDPTALVQFWRALAPTLSGTDARLTFPEVLNEPVFAQDAPGWATLQAATLAEIRGALPHHTVILTGQDWGSIPGLLALPQVADGNVVYSFHFYDPSELTSIAAYRPGLDAAALVQLPFPMSPAACAPLAAATDPDTAGLIRFTCAMGWGPDKLHDSLAKAGAWARRNNAALLLGEFGASVRLNAPARLAWLAAVRSTAEQQGIGWAIWGYDDAMGFAIPNPPPARPVLNAALLEALGLGNGPSRAATVPAQFHRLSAP